MQQTRHTLKFGIFLSVHHAEHAALFLEKTTTPTLTYVSPEANVAWKELELHLCCDKLRKTGCGCNKCNCADIMACYLNSKEF